MIKLNFEALGANGMHGAKGTCLIVIAESGGLAISNHVLKMSICPGSGKQLF